MKILRFTAKVKLGKNIDELDIPFTIGAKNGETELVWDDIENAAYDRMCNMYSDDDFPNKTVQSIFIVKKTASYPVIKDSESEETKNTLAAKYGRVLVVPEYEYTLTPEAKLYYRLQEAGLIDFDFDVKKIDQLVEIVNSCFQK